MQALLEIKKGEKPYKMGISEWLKDEDGPVLFKMISKKRLDGQIELVFTQRVDALKRIIHHISFAEKDFWAIIDTFDETMKGFIPNFSMEVQNVDMEDVQNLRIGKNNILSSFKFRLLSWLECKYYGLKKLWKK